MSPIPPNLKQSIHEISSKISKVNFFSAAFFLAVLLVILKSNFFVFRSPLEFNFGGEWDFMLTAKEYARHTLTHNKLLSYWATYDNSSHHLAINRYTHYPVFAYLPYILALKFFKTGFASQLMWVNLIYFFGFSYFLYRGVRDNLKHSSQILFVILVVCLFYSGYWKAILGSFGIYTVSIAIAPALSYAVMKNKITLTTTCFAILCLTMYEAFFPCFFFFLALAWQRKKAAYVYLAIGLPLFSLILRVLTNYWYYQSWQLVWLDLVGAYGQRSAECALISQQTAENIKNYGQVATCGFDYFISNHIEKLSELGKKLPGDLMISYGAGFFFFIYALIISFIELITKLLGTKKEISLGSIFALTYLGGMSVFTLLLPAMVLQGWAFFILMPISIIGFFSIFNLISPLIEKINLLHKPIVRILFILPLLWIFVDRTGFSATLNEKEIHLSNSVQLACDNHQGQIYTNLSFNYFTYICKDTNFLLYYTDPKPNENLYIRFAQKDIYLENSPVFIEPLKSKQY